MASVFYLVIMFMVYTMMVSNNNNNLHCQAAAASSEEIDYKCLLSIANIIEEMIDAGDGHGPNFVSAPNGSLILNPKSSIRKRCRFVPKTELSGRDLVLCKCKVQDFGKANEEKSPGLKLFNALDADKQLAISCGFNDTDNCDAAFPSVLTPCEADAREAMNTCAPMVKAAFEKDVGNRGRQICCFNLNEKSCKCSSYMDGNNPKYIVTSKNKFLRSLNDTLRDKCGLYNNGPVCRRSQNRGSVPTDCLGKGFGDIRLCTDILNNSRIPASGLGVEEAPLVDVLSGCCLERDWCKCDPRSVSCCQKLGELSKKGRDGCMCKLLNSKTTPASTLDFLNFVRSNYFQIRSCNNISPVFTDTCEAPLPSIIVRRDPPSKGLNRGFNTNKNPNDRTIPT